MDWRNYQFWRKKVRRLDETSAEFDLLIQRTKQRITIGERLGESIRLLQGTSQNPKKISRREHLSRNFNNLRNHLPFFKKFR